MTKVYSAGNPCGEPLLTCSSYHAPVAKRLLDLPGKNFAAFFLPSGD